MFADTQKVRDAMSRANGDVYRFAGPAQKEYRRGLMQAITGERLPLAKCGVNAIREALVERLNMPGGLCIRERERLIDRWARTDAADCAGMNPARPRDCRVCERAYVPGEDDSQTICPDCERIGFESRI